MSIPVAFARSGWLFLAALAACAPARTPPLSAPPAELGRIVPGRVTDHVIIISLDGMRPDAITRFRPRTLRRLIAEGSHSPEAQTTLPSRTLPSHMSMMSGKKPEAHGVINNEDPDETRWMTDVPTVMAVAHDRGLQTIALFSKSKFRQIYEPDALDYADQPGGWLGLRMAGKTAGRFEHYLQRARPQLSFIHFAEPDYMGHTTGWTSWPYGWTLRYADGAVARVLAAADRAFGAGNYTVIITADHGGHRFSHGSDDPRDMTIPWIAWGKGVRPGNTLPKGIRTMDTAATALWLLGIPIPERWVGSPVEAAFLPP